MYDEYKDPDSYQSQRADALDSVISAMADELLTAVIHGETAYGWSFPEVITYLTEEGIEAQAKYLQESLRGAVMPETNRAYIRHLEEAALEIAQQEWSDQHG